MSLCSVSHLSFTYEGSYTPVFEDLTFQLDTRWKTGLIGRNGRGKTTLLQLLTGQLTGTGTIAASVSFSLFPYALPLEQTARQAFPHLAGWELEREISRLELDPECLDRPMGTLSPGQRAKLQLAVLFLREDGFLLIDEPTNHLDLEGRRVVSRYLRSKDGFLLVSHDRDFLDGCVDHILYLGPEGAWVQRGNYSQWKTDKDARDNAQREENARLGKEIHRLQDAARRASQWSDQTEAGKYGSTNSGLRVDRGYVGHKAAKMMKRSKALERRREAAVEEKSRLLRDVEEIESLRISPLPCRRGPLVELKEVVPFYGETPACAQPVTLQLLPGERLALQGSNGCGKSTLLHLIEGQALPFTGELRLASGVVLSTVAQDTSSLRGSLSQYAQDCGIEESLYKAILRKLGFSRSQLEGDLSRMSSGQKKKALIARSLCQKAHLYLWDEPLNFIDLPARLQIEELLLEGKPTLLFVEHDAAFTRRIATRLLSLDSSPL